MDKRLLAFLLAPVLVFALAMLAIVAQHESRPDGGPQPIEPRRFEPGSTPDLSARVGADGKSAETARQALERRLRLYQGADTLQRGRIVHSIREKLDTFRGPLEDLVVERAPGVVVPAILVAGRLGLDELRISLMVAVDDESPEVRVAAIRALGYMKAWDAHTLGNVLEKEKVSEVLIAALEVAVVLREPPLETILGLLCHDNWSVARAARNAVPSDLSTDQREVVRAFFEQAEPAGAILGVQAVSGTEPIEARDALILEVLDKSPVWSVRAECLKALLAGTSGLTTTEPVWKVVDDPTLGRETVVKALSLFERTGAVEVERMRRTIPELHPVERLSAARCLVTAGDRDGLRVLIDLLETVESENVDDEDRDCAVDYSHAILVELAGEDFGRTKDAWLPWYRSDPEFEPEISIPQVFAW